MELRVNEDRLNINNMRQLLELVDAGVLVDVEKEAIEGIQNTPDVELGYEQSPRKTKNVKSGKKYWTLAEERKLMLLKRKGLSTKEIARKIHVTKIQVRNKITNTRIADKLKDKEELNVQKSKAKGPYFSKEMKKYILKAIKRNTSFPKLEGFVNGKFKTKFTKEQLKERFGKRR